MLVDLGRNDLGRVCASGTVSVDELMVVERYSHVMHIVSNVIGELAPGKTAWDLLKACSRQAQSAALLKFGQWKSFITWS